MCSLASRGKKIKKRVDVVGRGTRCRYVSGKVKKGVRAIPRILVACGPPRSCGAFVALHAPLAPSSAGRGGTSARRVADKEGKSLLDEVVSADGETDRIQICLIMPCVRPRACGHSRLWSMGVAYGGCCT